MDITEIRNNLENLPDLIEKAEFEYTEAKAIYSHMQDMTKHVLALLKESFSGSNPQRESKALASKEYLTHLGGLKAVAQEAGKKGAYFHKLQNTFEAMRSLNKNV